MSWVSVAAFSLPVSSAAIECNLMILQLESQSRIGQPSQQWHLRQ